MGLLDWLKDKFNEIWEYCKFWYIVDHYEEAVILLFGKYSRTLKPGLHFKVPIAEIGLSAHVKPDTMEIESICVTTLDGKTIMIGLALNYQVTDVKMFLIENNDAPSNMKDMSRGELSDLLEEKNWEDIKKKTTKNAINKKIDEYFKTLGVTLLDLKFTNKAESRAYRLFSEEKKDKVSLITP